MFLSGIEIAAKVNGISHMRISKGRDKRIISMITRKIRRVITILGRMKLIQTKVWKIRDH